MLVSGLGEVPQELKSEGMLRVDQQKLRKALDHLNGFLNALIEQEIRD